MATNPYMNPASRNAKVDRNLFYFQDLMNPKMTWKLYSQESGKLVGPLLTGFYTQEFPFGIQHGWSEGMGDTLRVALEAAIHTGVRKLGRRSRDIYNLSQNPKLAELLKLATNSAATGIGKIEDWLGQGSNLSDSVRNLDLDLASIMNDQLTKSDVITQGKLSKLYESTTISIPEISKLDCVIWSTPDVSCVESIRSLVDNKFLGEFNLIADGRAGYWTAPNNIELGLDNPLENDKLVEGAFTLRVGPYLLKNLLLASFNWTYSKQFAAYPDSSGKLKITNKPAYASCTLDLNVYKYKTKAVLNSVFIPQDTESGTTEIPEVYASSKYNQNK